MPEQDFELYLSLLSRFLRLKTTQRGEIADELRDHLEARLEELAATGLSRDKAIRAALDEFGDAAELANHFTQVAHIRKRKLIMRVTFGTIAALAAALMITTAFWPETRQAPVRSIVIAQESPAANRTKTRSEPATAPAEDDKAALEAKLSKVIGVGNVPRELGDAPLAEALEHLGGLLEVDILIDHRAIEEGNVDLNSMVLLPIKRTKLTGRMALDLMLEPLGLSYAIRDGLIRVTTAEQANQIQVYNIRDLLPSFAEHVGGGGAPSGARVPGAMGGRGMGNTMSAMMGGAAGDAAGGMAGGMGGGIGGLPAIRETESLAELVAATIDPKSWDCEGGNGSIILYHDLLVVKNSQTVHGKIKALLEMMRTSANPRGATSPAGAAWK